ncbi:MAG: 4Fe-4S binding protein [Deltaproteobacteria bacterium]|jgi:polyferredoxin|nr:4Fe-4S binding protein [Deltaproteobacteria bacterium]
MKAGRLRALVQYFSFLILMYGGRIGIHLGSALPCFACPFVPGCGGFCYLMGLQGYIGFGLAGIGSGMEILKAAGWFLVFVLLTSILGKAWCGWICPFGLIQDWLSWLRKKLGVRERLITPAGKKLLGSVKYIFLFLIVTLPPLITAKILPPDFYLPFCSICPGKLLLPLFAGETKYLALNLDNAVTFWFSLALIAVTASTLAGVFFKDRLFCIFCPLLAMIHLLRPLTALRLVKEPGRCPGCGSCRRSCPMDTAAIDQNTAQVQTIECLDCLKCLAVCPSSGALSLKFLGFTLFTSSRWQTVVRTFS